VRDGRAVETPVEAGAPTNGFVEVRGSLAAGDRVILTPPADLRTGMPVKAEDGNS
jgi:multidrug efflux pump subunit AcrA (membrane-fusion protein)